VGRDRALREGSGEAVGADARGDLSMFDRFTDHAKRVMNLARQQAQRLNHQYLDTEHILLGLLDEKDCRGCAMLMSLGMEPDRIRTEVGKQVKPGSELVTMGALPFAPRAKKVLEYSMEEAASLGSTALGTEHVLLGLVRETAGVASKALSACGMSLEKVRALAREQANPEDAAGKTSRGLAGAGDHRSSAWRLRVLEDAVAALTELQELELAARLREAARKHGSRKWQQ